MQARYEIAATIRHRGERGRKREASLATFLRENLPDAYGIGTGEIFSFAVEDVSPQCDVIVYDALRTPIFGKYGVVQQIPIEGTYCVIEVRSVLDGNALRDAEAKFAAIRGLWRRTYKKKGKATLGTTCPAFILFGYRLAVTKEYCVRFVRENNKEQDSEVVALDSGCIVWIWKQGNRRPSYPAWLDEFELGSDMYTTLALFFFSVLMKCETKLKPIDYMQASLNF